MAEPANPAGQLQMARAFSAFANPRAAGHWMSYFALTTNASVLDSLEFARYSLQLGRTEAARRQLASVQETNSVGVLLARAALETNATVAGFLLATARRLAETSGEKLAVATTSYASASLEAQLAGRAAIMELAGAGDRAAQLLLLTQSGTNAAFAVASFERFPANRWLPELQPVADLVAGRVRTAEPLLERLRQRPDDLELAAALANLGADLTSPQLLVASLRHTGLFLLQLDQLCAQLRWRELGLLVMEAQRALPLDLRSGLAALAAFRQDDTNTAHAHLLTALAETGNVLGGQSGFVPGRLLGLAQIARAHRYPELEGEAWLRLIREPELREPGSHRLFELGRRSRRLTWVAAAAKQLADGEPTSAWFGTWVYARCLLQMSATGVPEPLGRQPDSVVAGILRHALLGETELALDGLEAAAAWPQKPARLRLVSALVYQRTGRSGDRRRALAELATEELFPEELSLLRQLQAGE